MIQYIINLGIIIVMGIISGIISIIKKVFSDFDKKRIEKIAGVVEKLYTGFSSTEKLNAFKELCKSEKINVKKAVKYLENHIIPLSKSLNTFMVEQNADINDMEFTN